MSREPFGDTEWSRWESFCLELINDRELFWRDEETVRDILATIRENQYVTVPTQTFLETIYSRSTPKTEG